jgi:transcriptional regulator with XRE-family HTH domain
MGVRWQLKRRRKARGYSQESLAEYLGVDRVTVGRWERGECEPHAYARPQLAKALQVSANELEALLMPHRPFPERPPGRTRRRGIRTT